MFGIFKKKESNSGVNSLSNIGVDMHSHILPGIDDGAQTIEDSLNLIGCLVDKGYQKFICTPHIYKELYPNTKETIQNAYESLLPFVKEKFPVVTIQYAAEYFMDEEFDEMLEKGEKLLTVFDNYVLVEHGFMQPPADLKQKIFNLQMAGYTPIYAHPERYEFFAVNKKAYADFFDAGCIFQINLLSLTGYYGKVPMELAKFLIEQKFVKLVGTDIHHERHIAGYNNFGANKYLNELINQGVLLNKNLL